MRTYVRVDLSRLVANYREIERACAPGAEVLAVVKANAYGHGAVKVCRALEAVGCRRFAVATPAEGAELREAGVGGSIVLFGGFLPGEEDDAARLGLTPMIHNRSLLELWRATAVRLGRRLPWRLEIDTGMGRLGMRFDSPQELAEMIAEASELELEGVATHLAAAEDFEDDSTPRQLELFERLTAGARALGAELGEIDAANSAAVAYRSLEGQTLVRPGLALYGYVSRRWGPPLPSRLTLKPVLEWRARVLSVKPAAAGDRLGYNGAYVVERPMRVAALGVGYADGYRRALSNRGEVLLGGERRRVLGRVSMDLTLVEADEMTRAGDEAVLLGEGLLGEGLLGEGLLGEGLDAHELGDRCGTIAYEVLCGISGRVPRRYV